MLVSCPGPEADAFPIVLRPRDDVFMYDSIFFTSHVVQKTSGKLQILLFCVCEAAASSVIHMLDAPRFDRLVNKDLYQLQ